jgi:stage V sporulation protein SpoVS
VGTPRSPVKWNEVKSIGAGAVQQSAMSISAVRNVVFALGVLLPVAAVVVIAVRRSHRKPADDRFER